MDNVNLRILRECREQWHTTLVQVRRQLHKEALHRFGGIYSQTVWRAYRENQIGLHKLCKLFEINRSYDALNTEVV